MPRWYLTNAAAGYVPPTIRAGWNFTSVMVTKKLSTNKDDGTNGQSNPYYGLTSVAGAYLFYRGVTEPLAVGDINSGAQLRWCVPCGVNGPTCYWRVHAYLTVGDSDVVRQVLADQYVETESNVFTNPDSGRPTQAFVALPSPAYLAGDRLVVCFGETWHGSGYSGFWYGTKSAAGVALADAWGGSPAATVGWVEVFPPKTFMAMPDPSVNVGVVAVLSPPVESWFYMQGAPQTMVVVPSRLQLAEMQGLRVPTEIVSMHHAIPGVTTIDDEWPDNFRPQLRVNETKPAPPPVYVVQAYHGCPGVEAGDDNWEARVPSYQPQMRLNTLPHTPPPPTVAGTWKVSETFLPTVGK